MVEVVSLSIGEATALPNRSSIGPEGNVIVGNHLPEENRIRRKRRVSELATECRIPGHNPARRVPIARTRIRNSSGRYRIVAFNNSRAAILDSRNTCRPA